MKLVNELRNREEGQQNSWVNHDMESAVNSPESGQTAETIQKWLVFQLAERLELEPHEIDIQKPFMEYNLNSIEAVNISGDLENFLGRRLSPTLMWDYPNIEALVKYLSESTATDSVIEAPGIRMHPEQAEAILSKLDQLPDEEVDALLNSILSEREG